MSSDLRGSCSPCLIYIPHTSTATTAVYTVLVAKPEGKRLLGRPRRRWEVNIKMDLQEVGWEALTGLIWLRIGTSGRFL